MALGLRKETADMCWALETTYDGEDLEWFCHVGTFTEEDADIAFWDYIPAWSLHRLIEMVKKSDYLHYNDMGCIKLYLEQDDFDRVIAIISVMVKEGYFNKEYLV